MSKEYLEDRRKFRSQLRVLKRGSGTAESIWREYRAEIIKNAKEQGWRDSELAFSLADFYEAMETVFGKRVMERADKAVKNASNSG